MINKLSPPVDASKDGPTLQAKLTLVPGRGPNSPLRGAQAQIEMTLRERIRHTCSSGGLLSFITPVAENFKPGIRPTAFCGNAAEVKLTSIREARHLASRRTCRRIGKGPRKYCGFALFQSSPASKHNMPSTCGKNPSLEPTFTCRMN